MSFNLTRPRPVKFFISNHGLLGLLVSFCQHKIICLTVLSELTSCSEQWENPNELSVDLRRIEDWVWKISLGAIFKQLQIPGSLPQIIFLKHKLIRCVTTLLRPGMTQTATLRRDVFGSDGTTQEPPKPWTGTGGKIVNCF